MDYFFFNVIHPCLHQMECLWLKSAILWFPKLILNYFQMVREKISGKNLQQHYQVPLFFSFYKDYMTGILHQILFSHCKPIWLYYSQQTIKKLFQEIKPICTSSLSPQSHILFFYYNTGHIKYRCMKKKTIKMMNKDKFISYYWEIQQYRRF